MIIITVESVQKGNVKCVSDAGQIYEGPSFIQLNTIAKCMDDEFKNK